MLISKESFEYAFYWSDQAGPPPTRLGAAHETAQVGFGSMQQAMLFLRCFSQLHEFRQLLSQRFPGQTFRWRIEDIYGKMADMMVRKRLLVVKRWMRAEGPSRAERTAVFVPRRTEARPDPQYESATFPSNHDGDGQATTLVSAAECADAFCEECEKARQAMRAAPAEVLEDPMPPDNDDVSQAATLSEAAASGAAFCEECEKALAALAAQQPPPEPELNLLPPSADEDQQAATLAAAAQSGVPFCEECEKALLALSDAVNETPPPAPPEPGAFPPNHDAAAQVAALQSAADSGIPFCEECEKGKAAAASA